MTDFLRLRHRLIPYLYSMNVRSASEDETLVQPMYWDYPEIEDAYAVPNQFFFGSELLVAPIVKPRNLTTGLASVKAWFPPGHRYVDIFTGIVYDGNRTLNLYRKLDEYPVFAAEGSIIPLDAATEPKNGARNPEGFEVLVVVGKNAQFSILEDPEDDSPEAHSTAPKSGERGSLVQYYQDEGKLSAKVTGRAWTFRFVALCDVKLEEVKVLVNGEISKDAEV
jgi:alpha-glucosidase (family GH31 glycosyl hydrolase)